MRPFRISDLRAIAGMAVALLAGCAMPGASSPPIELPWQDEAFAYDAALVRVTERSLFELDPAVSAALRMGEVSRSNERVRREQLLKLVFGADLKAFQYAGGHSTPAAETWRNRRGDCLSLSIMTLALARELGLEVHVQEVRVPVSFDRRGGVDFLNKHVNVLMRNATPLQAFSRRMPAGDIVIDFEPQVGSHQRGTALSDQALLARFLSNRGAEQLADGRNKAAYAHFKAAILAEPGYAAVYNNLAQLYLRHGINDAAEATLRRALALDADSDLALVSLHQLLVAQGRTAEAQVYERRLLAQRDRDPYYWLGLGIDHLQHGRDAQAVRALEQAQGLSSGFEEVHRFLSVAYWRTGQRHKARDQLALLATLEGSSASVAKLNRKFGSGLASPTLQ